jgi:RHS repeat-associated protein
MRYQYNAKGERVRKYGTGGSQEYSYDESGKLLRHKKFAYDQEIIWLDNMPIGVSENGSLHGILTDHLNTPRQVFSIATQQTKWRWNASDNAFGETAAVNTGMEFGFRFPGQIYDNESGMHYNYFRDYDPGIGRYLQPDPIGLAGGIGMYGYVNGAPINSSDAFGLIDLGVRCGSSKNGFNCNGQPIPRSARRLSKCETSVLGKIFGSQLLGGVNIIQGLPSFAPGDAQALTIGNNVFLLSDKPNTNEGIALLAHEITHSAQYRRYGSADAFITDYFSDYLVNRLNGMDDYDAYSAIPVEIEAESVGDYAKRILQNEVHCDCL